MRPLLVSFPLLLGVGLLCFAAAPPPPPVKADDQLDYLFLASDRPVLIRMHIRIGDLSYDAPWAEFVDKLFAWFDKDNDGSLSPAEVARLPATNSLISLLQGGGVPNGGGVPFAAIDANKDGKVTKEEFRAYYRNGGFRSLQFSANNFQAASAKQINESIYKRLDKAGDGYLTADKVAGMYEKLRSLDENEDEMLDKGELNGRAGTGMYYEIVGGSYIQRGPTNAGEPSLMEVTPAQEAVLVKQLMDKYDRNKDGKLTPAEVGLPPALFAALDADKDGSLSAAELRGYFATRPDLVLRLQIGTRTATKGLLGLVGMANTPLTSMSHLTVVNEKSLDAAWQKKVSRTRGNAVALELGDTRMSLQVNAARSAGEGRYANVKNYYLGEFDRIAGKKGYVERSDEKGQQPFLFQVFLQADKNADGKLTRAELIAWLDLVASSVDANIIITATDLGRGLFTLLDADGDERLSLREMKSAWSRLKPLAKGGKLTQADLPRTIHVVVGQNSNINFRPASFAFGGMTEFRPAPRANTPPWFRKMDRNNDGDISPREWLGTAEDFAAIDADGDGLISLEEAVRFEAKKKQKKD